MKIDDPTLALLRGDRFSNGFRFDFERGGRPLRRFERLVEMARGRRVLHVGCCDHVELIESKLIQDRLLHRHLSRAALRCVGVDTNEQGVARLHELGFPQVFTPAAVPDEDFDICLLADVIEHVGDVVAFLREMRRYRFGEILVVTPNLFRLRNFLSRGEVINTDHRYWFSPFTLCKVLVDAGYTPRRVELLHGDHVSWRGAALARVLDFAPKYRDTLLVSAAP